MKFKTFKSLIVAVMLIGSLSQIVMPSKASAGPETQIGNITILPYNFQPVGFIKCDGRLLNISDYEILYTLIGTQYGGNGQTTFAIPDLRGDSPTPMVDYYIATEGIYPSRN
ncbi:phage tail protein [Paenibacillus sp. N3.4]|uniref:phage tail protein n=1 Tax=Paenibacillus sp. N3.4 TaxID=2603222 RepID=UPI0011C8B0F8|nr:tail fiber protein [Paenibacillus sp. N3.4]TXK76805.1 microcystin-dependent protein [Paenibacillus sp. N3.4]